jgi:RHS repeat-associated protein
VGGSVVPLTYYELDNDGRTTATDVYDGSGYGISYTNGVPNAPSSSLLRAKQVENYDTQGRDYLSQVYSVNPSTGALSTSTLNTNTYFDHRDNVVETAAPGGQVTKTTYDGADRPTVVYTTDGAGGTSWGNAFSVSSDNVLQQVEQSYDANGNVILTTTRQRFDNETATGALSDPGHSPKARVSYEAFYYDAVDRQTADVNVGTNGGSAYSRPSSVPSRSDTVLVTTTAYNAAGFVDNTVDPAGEETKVSQDALGRTTQTIEDYTNGTPTASSDKTTNYTYDGDGNTLTVSVALPSSAVETTQYVYQATTASGSAVNSNDLLVKTEYPDPSTGAASTSNQETYTVDALGERLSLTDRNGNVHQYSYDSLGDLTSDAVTTLGSNVDGTVRRRDTAYNLLGQAYLFTSYNASSGGTIVNQVQDVFNGLGQLTTEYQSHSGAVNTSTTPNVQYAYSEMSGGANNSRLVSMTYPNGRVLTFNYNTGVDSAISRLSSISDSSATLESYAYLGLDTIVARNHPQTGVNLTYIGTGTGDAGDKYVGLDRFGRVVDQLWVNPTTSTTTDEFTYGYSRDSNALWRNNTVNTAFGELYSYDGEQQLSSYQRGTLNSTDTGLVGSASDSQSYTTDAVGNFSRVTTNGTPVSRTNNKDNELTAVGTSTLAFDGNGNLTTDQNGNTLVYTAWNQLEQVKNGSTVIDTYGYDAEGRRITENPGTQRDLYYSDQWQVLEERIGGSAQVQYVWSAAGQDTLVERDRSPSNNGILSERLYVQQDANDNVTALVNTTGSVVERYADEPFGQVLYLSASFVSQSSSNYAEAYLFQGQRTEISTGLGYFRARDYSPALERFAEVDPTTFGSGDVNFYRSFGNNPTDRTDPSGLFWSLVVTVSCQAYDTFQYATGQIDRNEFAVRTTINAAAITADIWTGGATGQGQLLRATARVGMRGGRQVTVIGGRVLTREGEQMAIRSVVLGSGHIALRQGGLSKSLGAAMAQTSSSILAANTDNSGPSGSGSARSGEEGGSGPDTSYNTEGGGGSFGPIAPTTPATPRPGRMHVEPVELSTGTGRDFVIPGRSVPERFSARLMDGGDTLQVTWTDSLRQTPGRLQQVQQLAGGPGSFSRITGRASADLEAAMRAGQFDAQQAAQQLENNLGGRWRLDVARVPGSQPPVFDIIATRIGK